jgi:hypothetical protein
MTTTNPRDRKLAVVLLAVLLVGGLGFLGFQLIWLPLKDKDRQIAAAQADIAAAEEQVERVKADVPRLRQLRKMSLPPDRDVANLEYTKHLENLLKDSGFEVGSFSVVIGRVSTPVAAPNPTAKKPAISKVPVTITATGDMTSLVGFLEKFYATPLLQEIKNLDVRKPITPTGQQRPGDLVITLNVEGAILDNAEKRTTLLGDKAEAPRLLAAKGRQYVSIAGKNVFFGTPPRDFGDRKSKSDYDPTTQFQLTEITVNQRGASAVLYDRGTNNSYTISQNSFGRFTVDQTYINNSGKKKLLGSKKELVITDDDDQEVAKFEIIRIDVRDVILKEDKKYYLLHMGERVSEAQELKDKELARYGITPDGKTGPGAAVGGGGAVLAAPREEPE